MQGPQSVGHVEQDSPGAQTPSPHWSWPPQSPQASQASGQQSPRDTQTSSQKQPSGEAPPQLPWHDRGMGHEPQSFGQESHDSVVEQVPSPQVGLHAPQSPGHVLQDSVPLQTLSPQNG